MSKLTHLPICKLARLITFTDMKLTFKLITALLFASQSVVRAADDLVVYPPVPGLAASEHYKVRVRSASDGSKWQKAFAFVTTCKTIEKKTDGYFDHLAGWTHTYVNFETSGAVEIEIARANGEPIHTAAVHPRRKASRVRWRKARQSSG